MQQENRPFDVKGFQDPAKRREALLQARHKSEAYMNQPAQAEPEPPMTKNEQLLVTDLGKQQELMEVTENFVEQTENRVAELAKILIEIENKKELLATKRAEATEKIQKGEKMDIAKLREIPKLAKEIEGLQAQFSAGTERKAAA
jgi:hypothetical protein